MDMDAPPDALRVDLAKLKLSMWPKEACCYDVPYVNVTVCAVGRGDLCEADDGKLSHSSFTNATASTLL